MKKVLAFLLACVLPVCALADTYGFSVAIDTDEMLFIDYLKAAMMTQADAASDPDLDTYIRMIQKLLHGLSLDVAFQDDAVSLAVQMEGGSLIDMILHQQGNRVLVTSSLLEGYALEHAVAPNAHGEADAQSASEQLEWNHLVERLHLSFNQWLNSLDAVETYGQFAGDAYEGGTHCTTWSLEDKDIAALVEDVFSEDVRTEINAEMNLLGIVTNEMWERVDSANDRVAKDNLYRYLLRVVSDDRGRMIGCSLAVYNANAQLATASLGIQDKELRLVFGFGVQEQNYWCEMTAGVGTHENRTFLGGRCLEWMAGKAQRFAYVKATTAPVSDQSWYCNVTKSGQRYLWDASLYEGDNASNAHLSSMGSLTPLTGTIDCSISIGPSQSAPLTLKLTAGPAEEIAAFDSSLMRCSTTDPEDRVQYQELMQSGYSRLLARLVKLLPLDLILQLSMPAP